MSGGICYGCGNRAMTNQVIALSWAAEWKMKLCGRRRDVVLFRFGQVGRLPSDY